MKIQEGDKQAWQQDKAELSVLIRVPTASPVMKDRSNDFLHSLHISYLTASLHYQIRLKLMNSIKGLLAE